MFLVCVTDGLAFNDSTILHEDACIRLKRVINDPKLNEIINRALMHNFSKIRTRGTAAYKRLNIF